MNKLLDVEKQHSHAKRIIEARKIVNKVAI